MQINGHEFDTSRNVKLIVQKKFTTNLIHFPNRLPHHLHIDLRLNQLSKINNVHVLQIVIKC